MHLSSNPWVWFMGLGMLSLFSFIYKENAAYRLFEHIYVGAAAGYAVVVNYGNILDRAFIPLTSKGQWSLLIPIILGVLLYARFIKPIAWISRWSMSFLISIGVGISVFGMLQQQLLAQARAAMVPLYVAGSVGQSINNIIMFVGVISVIFYFFFAVEQKGTVKKVSMIGRYVMMVTFGVAFGNVVMGRLSLLLGCISDVFGTWLGIL
jgi:hypothetical protein